MPSLAETQNEFRRAVGGETSLAIEQRLTSPGTVNGRLSIYRRHFRESFRRHLRGRYPTIEWLAGTDAVLEFADATLRRAPPRAPSLAEYGAELIEVVANACRDGRFPHYLADVARLDWELGRLSVATEKSALPISALERFAAVDLVGARLTLQPGLAFVASRWSVDDLVRLHLEGSTPDQFVLSDAPVFLQLRGSAGRFAMLRLSQAEFGFRQTLSAARPLADAAEAALTAAPSFDLSTALARLFTDGLVIATLPPEDPAHD